jgi:hypothetical protein
MAEFFFFFNHHSFSLSFRFRSICYIWILYSFYSQLTIDLVYDLIGFNYETMDFYLEIKIGVDYRRDFSDRVKLELWGYSRNMGEKRNFLKKWISLGLSTRLWAGPYKFF